MPTASGIIDIVRARVEHSGLSDVVVLDAINDAQRTLQRRFPLRFQEAIATAETVSPTTGDFQTMSLPTDVKVVTALYHVVSGEHQLVRYRGDFTLLVDELAGSTAGSDPVYWSLHAGTLYLFPKLSSAATMQAFYEASLPDLVSTGSNSFTETAPEVLKDAATAEYYDALGESDKAQVWHAKAESRMRLLLKEHKAHEDAARDPTPTTPGTIRQRKRLQYRGYTWW